MNPENSHMLAALEEARKGLGLTRPNPAVGAVVVKGGKIIARGFHPKAGDPHAEIFALREAGSRARGADLYVTLEPCSTRGRTGPCVEAIIKAGVRRVFVGSVDPNPRHAGQGLDLLREAGVKVQDGLCPRECDDLLRAFSRWVTTGLPFVTVKLGLTLDGRIADSSGSSRWITGEAAREKVQALRREVDAIWVARGTLRADNPSLLPRPDLGRRPYRLVLDPLGNLPLELNVFTDGHPEQTLVFTTAKASASRRRAWLRAGVEVLPLDARTPDDLCRQMLAACGARGLLHVLCEGGGSLAGQLVRLGLAQELALFYNPSLMGSDGRASFALTGLGLDHRPHFHTVEAGSLGRDFFVRVAEGLVPEELPLKKPPTPAGPPVPKPERRKIDLAEFFDY